MDCYANKTLEHKEEEQHINGSTITVKDAPSPKIIGEECQEDKEEVDDHSTIPPMPHHL